MLILLVLGCAGRSNLPASAGMGPNPVLPAPHPTLIPDENASKAIGWGPGERPVAAPGTVVAAFAEGLEHPRFLYVLPNGDVLVAETNAPRRPLEEAGVRAKVMAAVETRAGGTVPSPDRVRLLRDVDGDGVAEVRSDLLTGLHSPYGMVLVGDQLYVANTDAVVRFPYHAGDTRITASATVVAELPAGDRNHHWTKSLTASPDGARLYVGVGSNSNAGEHGMEEEANRGAVWEIDLATSSHRVYASGLRNPVGFAWRGDTLWLSVIERDELGNDLVPDYLTRVQAGGFYGWPYSYYGVHLDPRVKPQRPDLVAKAIVPDYALGAHTTSLGLCDARASRLPFVDGVFVAQHGSWNRDPPSGYKVIFLPFVDAMPSGLPTDVLTGFFADGEAHGRPTSVAIDTHGALLVADDVGNTIWRVTAPPPL